MEYRGPERRRHRVYVTRATEYHLREDVCVAVWDRRSGTFRAAHLAEGLSLADATATVGGALRFRWDAGRELVTGRVERIDRPEARVVQRYAERP